MATTTTLATQEQPWYRGLTLGAYTLAEAARLAGMSPQSASRWHALAGAGKVSTLGTRRVFLSWLELIKLAVAARLYQSGLSLREVASLHKRTSQTLSEPHPFATERFALDTPKLLTTIPGVQRDGSTLVGANSPSGQPDGGQRLRTLLAEFDYEDGLVLRWHPVGRQSMVCLNPRICFGQPMIQGVKTRILAGRRIAGESIQSIVADFALKEQSLRDALAFEATIGNP